MGWRLLLQIKDALSQWLRIELPNSGTVVFNPILLIPNVLYFIELDYKLVVLKFEHIDAHGFDIKRWTFALFEFIQSVLFRASQLHVVFVRSFAYMTSRFGRHACIIPNILSLQGWIQLNSSFLPLIQGGIRHFVLLLVDTFSHRVFSIFVTINCISFALQS